MNKTFQITFLLITALSLSNLLVYAQDAPPATQPSDVDSESTTSESADVPPSQEVEINEDNYRQFMELKDARQQRDMLPENSYQSQAGLQSLDKLPEASQKHLRNQLREIIVQGDKWQPGDEEKNYPYVPSAAAMSDQALQKQEAEAWGELVDGYHEREAEIYARSSRMQSAGRSTGESGDGSEQGQGHAGGASGQSGASGSEGQAGQEGQKQQSQQGAAADSYSPDSVNEPDERNNAGVSQNAMEFLQRSGLQGSGSGGRPGEPAGRNGSNDGQNGTQEGATGGAQAQAGQQRNAAQRRSANPASPSVSPAEPETDIPDGTSQNALEYLTGGNDQQQSPDDTQLIEDQPGTLSIEELLNAQGVLEATGGVSPSVPKDDPDRDDPQANSGGD